MPEILTGWKILSTDGRLYRSAILGRWAVQYLAGRWTQPADNCGPLCVFETKSQALVFIGTDLHTRAMALAPCSYELSRLTEVWKPQVCVWPDRYVQRSHSIALLPTGTRLADRVRLDEKPKLLPKFTCIEHWVHFTRKELDPEYVFTID